MGDMLSQEEIAALLSGGVDTATEVGDDDVSAKADDVPVENPLTPDQQDILGEVGNISMGTAATTLFTLLNQKVLITTPIVTVKNWLKLSQGYDLPCVGIRVNYKEGLKGSNILILKDRDVKIITDLMMGGEGTVTEPIELNDLDLSAIGEAMNQMVGSSSTSLSTVVNRKIDIDTPQAFILNFGSEGFFEDTGFKPDDIIACVAFRMEIGDLIDSEIMQVIPIDFAKELVDKMMVDMLGTSSMEQTAPAAVQAPPPVAPVAQAVAPPPQVAMPQPAMPQPVPVAVAPAYHPGPVMPSAAVANVSAQPATFQTLDMTELVQQKENIGIIMDVPLEVTVELGRTSRKIREILEFAPGTIVDLDKLAGEPIDILVNGKFIGKGEVVVIDESFGIRVTDIISVEKRI